MDNNPRSPLGGVDTQTSIRTADLLQSETFDGTYNNILSLEENLHGEKNSQKVLNLTNNLKKYAEGTFHLNETVEPQWIDFLREQALTAFYVYEAKTGGDFSNSSDIISTVESEFDNFASQNFMEGIEISVKRLEWLSESIDVGTAARAKDSLENRQQLLAQEKENARKKALKGALVGTAGRKTGVVALAIGGGIVLALIVGGIVVSTLPLADGSAARAGTDTDSDTNPTASPTATPLPTLPMTPTQWLPAGMVGTQLAITPEAPTIEATNVQATQEIYPLVTSTSEPLSASQETRHFFEMAGLTSSDYLEHDDVFAGTILTLPEKTDKAVREKILPFLPEFVRDENEDPLTYLYRVGSNDEIGLREDEALAGSDTQLRIVRYDLKSGEFDLIQNVFQATEIKRLFQSSLWEFRFTPNQLKNSQNENPYNSNYLYIALQHLDADGVEFSQEDLNGVDQTRLIALLEGTTGVEFFRLITFVSASATATPTAQPSSSPAPEQPSGGGGQNPNSTEMPTQIPIPTGIPTQIPIPTGIPTQIPIPLVLNGTYTFKGEERFRVNSDKLDESIKPLFAGYKPLNGEIHLSLKEIERIFNSSVQ